MNNKRNKFPKRAVVTSGMPYGNKELHIGHICTMIWADTLSRFLKNAIGAENVLFLSSTDAYGSSVTQKAMQMGVDETEVVRKYHDLNLKTIEKFNIGFDFYGSTCFEPLKTHHKNLSDEVFMMCFQWLETC